MYIMQLLANQDPEQNALIQIAVSWGPLLVIATLVYFLVKKGVTPQLKLRDRQLDHLDRMEEKFDQIIALMKERNDLLNQKDTDQ